MKRSSLAFFILLALLRPGLHHGDAGICYGQTIEIPELETLPSIDGDLSEWKDYAFSDGLWDIHRVMNAPWYEPKRNRITDHGNEPSPEQDLAARYYMAWANKYLLLGAEVRDNVNDVEESRHAPKRWYYKDAIAWFFEIPRDTIPEKFTEGNHAFAFVIDTTKPDYGAWWRHGTQQEAYLEEPLPMEGTTYAIILKESGYILEVKLDLETLGIQLPKQGDEYGVMIVHTDPDGGEYGGHLLIYGKGDLDSTWSPATLVASKLPVERKER